MRKKFAFCAGLIALSAGMTGAEAANIRHGEKLAKERCAACHATGKHGASPNLKAPTFRRIATQWPLEQLQEAFAEGIVTGHGPMPEFTFEPNDIDDLLAYIGRLKRK